MRALEHLEFNLYRKKFTGSYKSETPDRLAKMHDLRVYRAVNGAKECVGYARYIELK